MFELKSQAELNKEHFEALFEGHEILKKIIDELVAFFKTQAENFKKDKERLEDDLEQRANEKKQLESSLFDNRFELSAKDETIERPTKNLEAAQQVPKPQVQSGKGVGAGAFLRVSCPIFEVGNLPHPKGQDLQKGGPPTHA